MSEEAPVVLAEEATVSNVVEVIADAVEAVTLEEPKAEEAVVEAAAAEEAEAVVEEPKAEEAEAVVEEPKAEEAAAEEPKAEEAAAEESA